MRPEDIKEAIAEVVAHPSVYMGGYASMHPAQRDLVDRILAAIPVGAELPAGVVVPRTLSATMHEAFLLNVETHYDDLSGRISMTELDRGYDALLSAAKGGEHE